MTALALVAFAANSVLARVALGPRLADAAGFTLLRLASGASVLWLWQRLQTTSRSGPRAGASRSSVGTALALFAYAACFSFAYLRIGAGLGALILFGAVQSTMLLWGLGQGERPRPSQWLGLALALGGLLGLSWPGVHTPDRLGMLLMALSGIAWGAYSIAGRASVSPVYDSANNFLRSVLPALLLALFLFPSLQMSGQGALLAVTSGAITSGLGYVAWYAALRELSVTQAAILQLSVPALAALGGVILLDESLSVRLLVAGAAILGVSLDTLTSHQKFSDKFSLSFPLLSDESQAVSKAYGVYKLKQMYGKEYWGIERTTFLIDKQGTIAKIYPKVKVEDHHNQVLKDLKALK